MIKNIGQVLIHILGCTIFLSVPAVFKPGPIGILHDPHAIHDFIAFLLLTSLFYFNYFVLVPKLYIKKRYLIFIAALIFCFAVIAFLPDFIAPYDELFNSPHSKTLTDFLLFKIGSNLFLFLAVVFFSSMLRISTQWRNTEKEKLKTELLYLKAQINPHFLFNTLNSIYSLALEKSEGTATAVVKLSDMMRYVLSEANKDFVPLEKETSYIQSYLELQQIRFGNSIQLSFEINGNTNGQHIAPLILIPFIENAFKHGVNAEENSVIKIKIDVVSNALQLKVFNNKVFVTHSNDSKSGLGIENTKSRLQLLYPGSHTLRIEDTPEYYSVSLALTLK